VVGILFEEGERNAAMDQLPSFKAARGEDSDADLVDYNMLFPNGIDYFYYSGSLTTPPCSEGVYWMIFKQPIIASPEQIEHYHNLLGFDNNRPIQPKNSRLVIE
jgi:carbonic anhydrase